MKSLLLTAACAVLGFAVAVPTVALMIRQLEPGRDKPADLKNLENRNISMPESGPFVLAHCIEPCRLGSWIKLYVGRIPRAGYLAVWAESGVDRVWYYPSESEFYPEVTASPEINVLSDGVKLSRSHVGHKDWTLKLALVDQRYTRDEVLGLSDDHVIVSRSIDLALGEGR
jgi:hypothetical protein